jgi:hypothetical protein
MTSPAEEELRLRLRRLRSSEGIDLRPATAYEAVTRQMVEALGEELKEIRGRLNGLLFMLAGAIVVDIVLRIAAM